MKIIVKNLIYSKVVVQLILMPFLTLCSNSKAHIIFAFEEYQPHNILNYQCNSLEQKIHISLSLHKFHRYCTIAFCSIFHSYCFFADPLKESATSCSIKFLLQCNTFFCEVACILHRIAFSFSTSVLWQHFWTETPMTFAWSETSLAFQLI